MRKALTAIAGMLASAALALGGCSIGPGSSPGSSGVDEAAMAQADGADWLSVGRGWDEQRFSPLDKVNAANVGQLGLAWSYDLDTARGQEATPLVYNGVMYVSTAWSKVLAFEAATGKLLWSYDPKVPRETLVKACCDAVNRGVAMWGGKIFVGTLDARLVALDAKTGKVVWETWTADKNSQFTITGAPRIAKGRVIIGNGGAEFIARGYVSAYDAETGKLAWRFYTVPGDPKQPFENKAMEAAAKTWTGEWWKFGGGGTVWDAITYDPATNLIFFGTGNGEPWNASVRSPQGGDNLYTSSVVAVNADTGEYAWHHQETPEDRWDFDSDAQIIVADLAINGQQSHVLLHAPKNGYFYVYDAKTGKLLSGKNYTFQNWTTGLDANGHPQIVPAARYDKGTGVWVSVPGAGGAHSWQPMSFSPKTGLVYIPVNEAGFPYAAAGKDYQVKPQGFDTFLDSAKTAMPADPAARAAALKATTGRLLAWDPVAQKERWSVAYPGPWNGGTLATAGNLVFQGDATGHFNAYAADTGKKLWTSDVQTGVIAAPMSFAVNGEQYVAVLAGWGGVWDIAPGVLSAKSGLLRNISRVLVFKLGGTGKLPPAPPFDKGPLDPPPFTGTPAQADDGANHYGRFCSVCHGDAAVAGGINPDLRHSGALNSPEGWQGIVHDGALKELGMVAWSPVLSRDQIENVRQYVIKRANEDKKIGPN